VTRHVALLRAVNVGGAKVAMSDLKALCEGLGFTEVSTLLNSGNVVFTSSKSGAALETLLEKEMAKRFARGTDFLVRSAKEWAALIAANPFPEMARRDPGHLVAMPLKDAPGKAAMAKLEAVIKGRETAKAVGKTLYLTYPDGIGVSKLTITVIEKALGTRGTARNWNTVLKVMERLG
jgi:uncharacterized protein (DUF1697 family)